MKKTSKQNNITFFPQAKVTVETLASNRSEVTKQKIENRHQEFKAEIQQMAEQDGRQNIPSINAQHPSGSQKRIPKVYKDLLDGEIAPIIEYKASLEQVVVVKQKAIEKEPAFQKEKEIETINLKKEAAQRETGRSDTDADPWMEQHPHLVSLFYLIIGICETLINVDALRSFRLQAHLAFIWATLMTLGLLYVAHQAGITIKRSFKSPSFPIRILPMLLFLVGGAILMSYCRAHYSIHVGTSHLSPIEALNTSKGSSHLLDISIFSTFIFYALLFCHFTVCGISTVLGFKGADSNRNFQLALFNAKKVPQLSEELKAYREKEERMHDFLPPIEQLRLELAELEYLIKTLERAIQELIRYTEQKIELAMMDYMSYNLRARQTIDPVPVSFITFSPSLAEAYQ